MSLAVTTLAGGAGFTGAPSIPDPVTAELPALANGRGARDISGWAGSEGSRDITGIVPAVQPSSDDIGVARSASPSARSSAPVSRRLRAAVYLTAAAAIAVAVALAVLGVRPSAPNVATAAASIPSTGSPHGLTTTSPTSASLAVGGTTYSIEVMAASPCWVQIQVGTRTVFAGTLQAGQSHRLDLRGPAQVQLGSSGGRLALTYFGRHFNLIPPAAPYSYSFT